MATLLPLSRGQCGGKGGTAGTHPAGTQSVEAPMTAEVARIRVGPDEGDGACSGVTCKFRG